ncbi:MAG: YaiI/YqxD family protein [Cyanobacteria bacterium SZAS LIN-3]|nr:YaiI/YqxD family protein [Cyanobacteria bacterium SZAS LIN-3]MBS2009630.1 YaiI/YqxD family protein [Cyanobacteria bacterium SZAS TMP-1]
MKIWVDADAAPGAVKDIVMAAAVKRAVEAIFVANKKLTFPESPLIKFIQVEVSPDAADYLIAADAVIGDLVITQDIPLAHALVTKGVVTISPRGVVFTPDNIGERLSVRDLMQGLRDTGEMTGGPKQFGDKEKRAFASAFDRELTRLQRQSANKAK